MTHKFHSMTRWLLSAACVGGGVALVSTAPTGDASAGEGGDLMFYVVNNQLTVGRYAFEPIEGEEGFVVEEVTEDIVLSEMGNNWEDTGMPGTDEPGIATDGSSPSDVTVPLVEFPFPATTGIAANAALLPVLGTNAAFWDGTGTPDFSAAPPDAIIVEEPGDFGAEIELGGESTVPSTPLIAWNSSDEGDGTGTAHDHYEFLLDASDAEATAGIYLFALDFTTSDSSIAGKTMYFLMGYGGLNEAVYDDDTLEGLLETAEGFVEANIVPEPAAVTLVALGGLAALRRRRVHA